MPCHPVFRLRSLASRHLLIASPQSFPRLLPCFNSGDENSYAEEVARIGGLDYLNANSLNMAFLYQIESDTPEHECWTVGDKPMVVGRGDSADVIIDDDSLSRSHFLLVREGKDLFLIDLHSSNGTFVNEKKVSAHRLQSGDVVRAGALVFCFSLTAITPGTFPALMASVQGAAAPELQQGR